MKCIWSPTAAKSLDKTIDYIIDNFGASTALKFIAKIEQWDSWISENPEMARIEPMRANCGSLGYETKTSNTDQKTQITPCKTKLREMHPSSPLHSYRVLSKLSYDRTGQGVYSLE